MQSNFIAPESVFLLSVEDIISLNLLFFDGTKSLMGQKSLCSINTIDLSQNIQTPIRMKSRNGFEITIDAIQKFLCANCTENSVPTKVTLVIRDPYIVSTVNLVIPVTHLLPKRKENLSLTTLLPSWESNGKWMLNMSLLPVIPALSLKSFINTQQ